jgi:hypothetical protein
LRRLKYKLYDHGVRTHKLQPLTVAAGTTQARTQAGTVDVSCALTARAAAARAMKNLENILKGTFLGS